MPNTPPFQVQEAQKKTQTGLNLLDGLSQDNYYIFVSSYDPWFVESGGTWSVDDALVNDYSLLDEDTQNAIKGQMLGMEKLYGSDGRLVQPRNHDFIGGLAQNITMTDIGYDQFVTSEAFDSSSDRGYSVYFYRIMTVPDIVIDYVSPLHELLNETNAEEIVILDDSAEHHKVGVKLLSKISNQDLDFVTQNFIPILEYGESASVQDRVALRQTSGEIQAIKITSGGSGYVNGETVTIESANGVGFVGEVVENVGEIYSVRIIERGRGYRVTDELTENVVTVDTVAGVDAEFEIVYAPAGGFGSNLINDVLPDTIMLLKYLHPQSMDQNSPFIDTDDQNLVGMNGYTVGILKAPNKAQTNDIFSGRYGTPYTELTLDTTLNISQDLETSRVTMKIYPQSGDQIRVHEGEIVLYNNQTMAYTFNDLDQSSLAWDLDETYDVELTVRDATGETVTVVQGVQITTIDTPSIDINSGEIIYAHRITAPESPLPIGRPWAFKSNIIKEVRLVAPLT